MNDVPSEDSDSSGHLPCLFRAMADCSLSTAKTTINRLPGKMLRRVIVMEGCSRHFVDFVMRLKWFIF